MQIKFVVKHYRCSLVIDSEDDASAEQARVLVCERGVVIIQVVPKALGSYTDSLALNLSNNRLHNDLVGGNIESSACLLDLVGDLLSLCLSVRMVVLFVLEMVVHDSLDEVSYLAGIEPVSFLWLESVSVFKCGAIEFSHT